MHLQSSATIPSLLCLVASSYAQSPVSIVTISEYPSTCSIKTRSHAPPYYAWISTNGKALPYTFTPHQAAGTLHRGTRTHLATHGPNNAAQRLSISLTVNGHTLTAVDRRGFVVLHEGSSTITLKDGQQTVFAGQTASALPNGNGIIVIGRSTNSFGSSPTRTVTANGHTITAINYPGSVVLNEGTSTATVKDGSQGAFGGQTINVNSDGDNVAVEGSTTAMFTPTTNQLAFTDQGSAFAAVDLDDSVVVAVQGASITLKDGSQITIGSQTVSAMSDGHGIVIDGSIASSFATVVTPAQTGASITAVVPSATPTTASINMGIAPPAPGTASGTSDDLPCPVPGAAYGYSDPSTGSQYAVQCNTTYGGSVYRVLVEPDVGACIAACSVDFRCDAAGFDLETDLCHHYDALASGNGIYSSTTHFAQLRTRAIVRGNSVTLVPVTQDLYTSTSSATTTPGVGVPTLSAQTITTVVGDSTVVTTSYSTVNTSQSSAPDGQSTLTTTSDTVRATGAYSWGNIASTVTTVLGGVTLFSKYTTVSGSATFLATSTKVLGGQTLIITAFATPTNLPSTSSDSLTRAADGISTLSPAPGESAAFMIGTARATLTTSGAYVLPDGQTILPGGTAVTFGSTVYTLAPMISTAMGITIAISGATHSSATELLLPRPTLGPGTADVFSGTTYSLPVTGTGIYINGQYVALLSVTPGSPVTLPNGLLATVTTPGGFITKTDAQGRPETISLDSGANAVVFLATSTTITSLISMTTQANAAILVIGGATYSAVSYTPGAQPTYSVQGQTLTPGGSVTATLSEGVTVISLDAAGAAVAFIEPSGTVVSPVSTPKWGAALIPPAGASIITVNSATYTAVTFRNASGVVFIFDGQTLDPGGSLVLPGQSGPNTFSFDSSGTGVVAYNGVATTTLTTPVASATDAPIAFNAAPAQSASASLTASPTAMPLSPGGPNNVNPIQSESGNTIPATATSSERPLMTYVSGGTIIWTTIGGTTTTTYLSLQTVLTTPVSIFTVSSDGTETLSVSTGSAYSTTLSPAVRTTVIGGLRTSFVTGGTTVVAEQTVSSSDVAAATSAISQQPIGNCPEYNNLLYNPDNTSGATALVTCGNIFEGTVAANDTQVDAQGCNDSCTDLASCKAFSYTEYGCNLYSDVNGMHTSDVPVYSGVRLRAVRKGAVTTTLAVLPMTSTSFGTSTFPATSLISSIVSYLSDAFASSDGTISITSATERPSSVPASDTITSSSSSSDWQTLAYSTLLAPGFTATYIAGGTTTTFTSADTIITSIDGGQVVATSGSGTSPTTLPCQSGCSLGGTTTSTSSPPSESSLVTYITGGTTTTFVSDGQLYTSVDGGTLATKTGAQVSLTRLPCHSGCIVGSSASATINISAISVSEQSNPSVEISSTYVYDSTLSSSVWSPTIVSTIWGQQLSWSPSWSDTSTSPSSAQNTGSTEHVTMTSSSPTVASGIAPSSTSSLLADICAADADQALQNSNFCSNDLTGWNAIITSDNASMPDAVSSAAGSSSTLSASGTSVGRIRISVVNRRAVISYAQAETQDSSSGYIEQPIYTDILTAFGPSYALAADLSLLMPVDTSSSGSTIVQLGNTTVFDTGTVRSSQNFFVNVTGPAPPDMTAVRLLSTYSGEQAGAVAIDNVRLLLSSNSTSAGDASVTGILTQTHSQLGMISTTNGVSAAGLSGTPSSSAVPTIYGTATCPDKDGTKYNATDGSSYTVVCDRTYDAEPLRVADASNLNECMNLCVRQSQCMGTTYSMENGICQLSSSMSSTTRSTVRIASVLRVRAPFAVQALVQTVVNPSFSDDKLDPWIAAGGTAGSNFVPVNNAASASLNLSQPDVNSAFSQATVWLRQWINVTVGYSYFVSLDADLISGGDNTCMIGMMSGVQNLVSYSFATGQQFHGSINGSGIITANSADFATIFGSCSGTHDVVISVRNIVWTAWPAITSADGATIGDAQSGSAAASSTIGSPNAATVLSIPGIGNLTSNPATLSLVNGVGAVPEQISQSGMVPATGLFAQGLSSWSASPGVSSSSPLTSSLAYTLSDLTMSPIASDATLPSASLYTEPPIPPTGTTSTTNTQVVNLGSSTSLVSTTAAPNTRSTISTQASQVSAAMSKLSALSANSTVVASTIASYSPIPVTSRLPPPQYANSTVTGRDGSSYVIVYAQAYESLSILGIPSVVATSLAICVDFCTLQGSQCQGVTWRPDTKECRMRSKMYPTSGNANATYLTYGAIRMTSNLGIAADALVNGAFDAGMTSWTATTSGVPGLVVSLLNLVLGLLNGGVGCLINLSGLSATLNGLLGSVQLLLSQNVAVAAGYNFFLQADLVILNANITSDVSCQILFQTENEILWSGVYSHYSTAGTIWGSGTLVSAATQFQATAQCSGTKDVVVTLDNLSWKTYPRALGSKPVILASITCLLDSAFNTALGSTSSAWRAVTGLASNIQTSITSGVANMYWNTISSTASTASLVQSLSANAQANQDFSLTATVSATIPQDGGLLGLGLLASSLATCNLSICANEVLWSATSAYYTQPFHVNVRGTLLNAATNLYLNASCAGTQPGGLLPQLTTITWDEVYLTINPI